MIDDMAIRRAAGVIFWHLHHGGTEESAIAKASKREVDLTEADLQNALAWALCQGSLRDLCNMMPRDTPLRDLLDAAGVPWRTTEEQ